MADDRSRKQFSIKALLWLMSVSAVGLIVLRVMLVYGGRILAAIVILTIPAMMLCLVLRSMLLGLAAMASYCSNRFRQSTEPELLSNDG